jgi:hypothetical protein
MKVSPAIRLEHSSCRKLLNLGLWGAGSVMS